MFATAHLVGKWSCGLLLSYLLFGFVWKAGFFFYYYIKAVFFLFELCNV